MGWECSWNQETRNAYKIVWGKMFVIAGMDNGKEKWDDDIRPGDVSCEDGRSKSLSQDRIQWLCLVLQQSRII
jgi:hypothetical protein